MTRRFCFNLLASVLWASVLVIEMAIRIGGEPARETRVPLTSRTVRTKYGDVSGVIVTLDSKYLEPVEVFRGIPYASPPLGRLRFMPPVTGALWSGVKVADKFSPVCPQRLPNIANETAALKKMPKGRLEYLKRLLPYLQNQSEDCLYLNIYAPAQGKTNLKDSNDFFRIELNYIADYDFKCDFGTLSGRIRNHWKFICSRYSVYRLLLAILL
ncbi:hypothetical protein WA026_003269 [Henosepilachna vigintioctopunctata]|uniref:Carboxylesterase type B domain-containing protein n=1 Tax=Henosepilachna vigintioctopunctata TaxID=420089 RepID=A0AAW1THB6_9CUCU